MALNIGKKIILMIIIGIILIGVTMGGSLYFYNKLISDSLRAIKNANSSLLIFKDCQLKIQTYKTTREPKLLNTCRDSMDKLINELAERSKEIQQTGNPELITAVEIVKARCKEIKNNLTTLQKGYNEFALTKLLSIIDEIVPKLNDVIFFEENKFEKENKIAIYYAIAAILLMFLIITSLSLKISRSVVSPIHKLISASLSSSKGDLTQSIKINSKDEMGH